MQRKGMYNALCLWSGITLVLGAAMVFAQGNNGVKEGKYDQQIEQHVTHELQEHDNTKNVHAKVEDGVVTLTGSVDRYIGKVDAEKETNEVDHVEGVRNQVKVSSQISDAELQKQLREKLAYDRIGYGVMFNNLTLGVNNGVVTIGGQVHDYPARDSAAAIAENTPGVQKVINNIKVLPTSPMDDQLRIAVARAVYGAPGFEKYAINPVAPIRIVVDNGHITLDGVVNSQMDKQLAETRAKEVPGVFSVKDNLVVNHGT
jgi:hyperosmotically inducible periplasmic protein